MNYAVLAPVAAAAVALFAAVQARRLALTPGWGDQGWFAVAAASSAGFALSAATSNADVAPASAVLAARIQMAFMAMEVWGWLHYVEAFLARRAAAPVRAFRAVLPGVGLLALVPGVVLDDRLQERGTLGPGFFQRYVEPTWLGTALIGACLLVAAAAAVRFLQAHRLGAPQARLHAVAVLGLLVLGCCDALALAGLHQGPFLLDVGFVLPVLLVGGSLATRFAQDARELADLRGRLEALVEERTRALSRTQDALFRAERLASLGQVASGVAHEVNNPAAVVAANLRFVRDALAEPPAPGGRAGADDEVGGAVDEAIEAMERITGLVRRLVDAGRLATSPRVEGSSDLEEGLRGAVAVAEARFGARVRWVLPEGLGLRVGASAEVVHDILLALLVNAGEAIPEERRGQVAVAAAAAPGGLLRVWIRDDGRGLDEQVAARAFEPFFSTKPAGRGSGLGLSVARGLAERHGGSLRLAARPGGGAEASLELPQARR